MASTDNPYFVNGAHKETTNIIMYDKPAAPSHKINHRNLVEGYINGFGSKVGVYSNHATIIEALKALFVGEDKQRQRDELERRKKLLREVVGAEIDSAKGLAKPKEPWYFTKFVKVEDCDDDVTKSEKYYHNSLVISKKPYFFRYLYPELNKKYKQYENRYNERAKASFGIKLKKVLAKQDKTEKERVFVKTYHKYSPVINTNCTMNVLCREFESVDFDIKWGKSNTSKLPHYDIRDFIFKPELTKQFKKMYQKWNNKKAVLYISSIFINDDDQDYKEAKFGVLDAIRQELREEYKNMGISPLEALTYIYALSLGYSKFNWGFAWEVVNNDILECLPENNALVPIQSNKGEEYLGHYYQLAEISKDKKVYTIDPETGEITFFEKEDTPFDVQGLEFEDLDVDFDVLDKLDDFFEDLEDL